MRLSKADFAGTGKVFAFSVQQYFKSKSTLVLLLVMLLTSVGSMLLMNLSMNRGMNAGHDAQTVYFLNQSAFSPALEGIVDYAELTPVEGKPEDWLKQLDAGEKHGVLVAVDENAHVTAYAGKDSAVGVDETQRLAANAAAALEEARYLSLGVTPEQIGEAMAGFRVQTTTQEKYEKPSDTDTDARFLTGFLYSILVYMLISVSTSYIVKAITEEKGSRLVEVLMVSVRPLALILGKILAAMCLVLASMALLALGLAGTRLVLGPGSTEGVVTGLGGVLAGLDAKALLIVLVSLVLGYLTFALLGGLSGASCATSEETEAASGNVMLLSMAGYILGIATSFADRGALNTFMSLCPIISVFVAPARYLAGQIDLWVLLASWGIQILTVIGLARFCAGVYGALLIHRGERVKLRQLLQMAKGGYQV